MLRLKLVNKWTKKVDTIYECESAEHLMNIFWSLKINHLIHRIQAEDPEGLLHTYKRRD